MNDNDDDDDYRSEPYDPYLPRAGGSNGAPAGGAGGGNAKTAAIQAQIDDTVGIMRENITKVAERGERLDSLQDKTGACLYLLVERWKVGKGAGWRRLAEEDVMG